MTAHPSQTGSETRIGIVWTAAVGRLCLGEDGAEGPHKLRGLFVCVFSSSIGPSDQQWTRTT